MYTNTATLTRSYRTVESTPWEPIRTRPRVGPDGEPVRFPRPARSTDRQRAIAKALGFRR